MRDANIIDSTLGSSTKSGYNFAGHAVAASVGRPSCHFAFAQPVTGTGVTQTGTRTFAISTEGVMYNSPDVTSTGYDNSNPCQVNPAAGYTPLNN